MPPSGHRAKHWPAKSDRQHFSIPTRDGAEQTVSNLQYENLGFRVKILPKAGPFNYGRWGLYTHDTTGLQVPTRGAAILALEYNRCSRL